VLITTFCPAILNCEVTTVDPSEFAEPLNKNGNSLALNRRVGTQESDGRQFARLLRPRRQRPRRRCAAQKRDELPSSQSIELHSVPASQGRIAGYRIGEDQSGGNEAILQPVSRALKDYARLPSERRGRPLADWLSGSRRWPIKIVPKSFTQIQDFEDVMGITKRSILFRLE
jgi:hypothetical protein